MASELVSALLNCAPEDRVPFLALQLDQLRPGWPQSLLIDLMREARWWVTNASRAERKAYCLACYEGVPEDDKRSFVAYVTGRAMADDSTPWDEMANAPGGPTKEGPTVVNFAAEKAKRTDPKARKSQFFTATMLDGKEVPARNWLVPGLIPSGTVTLLTGDGGTGKSLLALQLATACALGKPWLGKTVAGDRALFVSAEDDEDELHRRLADVLEAEEASFADLDQLALRSFEMRHLARAVR